MAMLSRIFFFSFIFVNTCLLSAPEVVSQYKNKLNTEWTSLENNLIKAFCVTKNDWQEFQKNNLDRYIRYESSIKKDRKKSAVELNQKTRDIIDDVLKKAHIDARNVDFVKHEDVSKKHFRAKASDSGVYLSEHNLYANGAKENEIAASILHELQHVYHWDDSFNYFVEMFIAKYRNKIDVQTVKNAHKKIVHFQEKRADLLAGLYSLIYASALVECYKKLLRSGYYDDQDGDTHPSFSKRIAYLEKLCDDLKNDPDMRYGQVYAELQVFKSRGKSGRTSVEDGFLTSLLKRLVR